jgi:hypothetical protein
VRWPHATHAAGDEVREPLPERGALREGRCSSVDVG